MKKLDRILSERGAPADALRRETLHPRATSPGTGLTGGAADQRPPWTWSWLRWHPGEGWTLFWICLIHALALVGLIVVPLPGWGVFGAAYALVFIGGLGTTVGYHRALAHRALRLHPAIEFLLIGAAMLNGSGSPATWCANHRLHHARADTMEDISSPRAGGFWWAHLRWLWQSAQSPIPKWAPDLDRPSYLWWTRFQIPIHALTLCIGLPFGLAAFFWLGAIRLTFALHAQCFVNSLAHMKKGSALGEDSSVNNAWLAPVQALQGENWHGNHHARPSSARLGWSWKQIDLGWWFIVILAKLRLATHVRLVRDQAGQADSP
jgi:fatty-acid desaturase